MGMVKMDRVSSKRLQMVCSETGEVWREVDCPIYEPYIEELESCVSWKEIEQLFEMIEIGPAKGYLYLLLSRRGYFKAELRKKLKARGFWPPVIERVLHDFQQRGYISDFREVERLIQSQKEKGKGPVSTLHSMMRKEVEGVDIVQRVQQELSEEWQRKAIKGWIEKKSSSMKKGSLEGRRKLYRFLERKGFDRHLVRESLLLDEW